MRALKLNRLHHAGKRVRGGLHHIAVSAILVSRLGRVCRLGAAEVRLHVLAPVAVRDLLLAALDGLHDRQAARLLGTPGSFELGRVVGRSAEALVLEHAHLALHVGHDLRALTAHLGHGLLVPSGHTLLFWALLVHSYDVHVVVLGAVVRRRRSRCRGGAGSRRNTVVGCYVGETLVVVTVAATNAISAAAPGPPSVLHLESASAAVAPAVAKPV